MVFLFEAMGDSVHLYLGALKAHARLKASNHSHEALVAADGNARRRAHRHPKLDPWVGRREFGWHHPYDCEGLGIDNDLFPQDGSVAAKRLRPQSVAQDHDPMFSPLLLLGSKSPAQLGSSAEHVKEIRRHGPAIHLQRLVCAGKIEGAAKQCGYAAEHVVLLLPVAKVRDGHRALIDSSCLL